MPLPFIRFQRARGRGRARGRIFGTEMTQGTQRTKERDKKLLVLYPEKSAHGHAHAHAHVGNGERGVWNPRGGLHP